MSLLFNSKIIITRKSLFPGNIMVKEGDQVEPETVLLRTASRLGRVAVINVAERLGVARDEISNFLLFKEDAVIKWSGLLAEKKTVFDIKQILAPFEGKVEKIDPQLGIVILREILDKPDIPVAVNIKSIYPDIKTKYTAYILKKKGDRVQIGETLAGQQPIPALSFYTKKISAPCSGTIKQIDYETGMVMIQKDLPVVDMKSYYWGKIANIIPEYGAEIEFSGYVGVCIYGVGEMCWGRLVEGIRSEIKGNIVFIDHLSDDDAKRMVELEPVGIIVGSTNYENIQLLLHNKIVAVVLEGFGKKQISKNLNAFLRKSENKNILINGTTQLRAGVIRPQIIVPSDEEYYKREYNEKVKIIWGEHYGKTGRRLTEPYEGIMDSGIKTWLSDVIFDDNKKISIPYANLEYL